MPCSVEHYSDSGSLRKALSLTATSLIQYRLSNINSDVQFARSSDSLSLPAMEPLSALSLAGNIVQFVQFSAKLVKKASEIRSSASGTTEELEDATIVSQSLQCMLQGMRMPTIPTSIHDKPLVDLAKGCSELCQELQGRVEHIKGKGVSSRTGSFGIAWRTLTRSGKLNLIEQRLDRYRSEILSHILFMIRCVVSI